MSSSTETGEAKDLNLSCVLFVAKLSQMNDLWRTQLLMTEYWRAYKNGRRAKVGQN